MEGAQTAARLAEEESALSPQLPLPLMPQKPKRPFPSWPVWVLFGVMLICSVPVLFGLGLNKDLAAIGLNFQRDAVGRSVVLTGTLSSVDTTSGMPKTTSYYEVAVPDADGGPDDIVTFNGGEQWGFPPSKDYPAEQSFLVITEDPPRSARHGPVGSIRSVTPETLQDAERDFAIAKAAWVVGIVMFWILALGLPAFGTLLGVRRRHARKAAVPLV
jgi:hypothetical protein